MKQEDFKMHTRFLKSYKKNTVAVFFSFMLTFLLLTAMLILIRTNFEVSNLQAKIEYAPGDCYIDYLSKEQVDVLKKDPELEWVGVQQGRTPYNKNNQTVFMINSDETVTTMTAKVIEGTLPQKQGEIAAEKWTLLNLGIEPVVGQEIVLLDYNTGEEKNFTLVGILSDMYRNKKAGMLEIYSVMDEENSSGHSYTAYLQCKDNVSYEDKIERIKRELCLDKKQIGENPARENYAELYIHSIEMILLIFVISMVVFYGIYRISVFSRMEQYGILRAIGMKKKDLQKMLLLELGKIYLWSVPVGIVIGIALARLIMSLSGDIEKVIYLFGEAVEISFMIPAGLIMAGILVVGIGVGMIGYRTGKGITDKPVIQIISGEMKTGKKQGMLFPLEKAGSKTAMLFRLGSKYILRDIKTSGFVILTICVGIMLFAGLTYYARIAEIYREDTKEMNYLNGQYMMSMLHYDNIEEGVSRQSAEKIMELDAVIDMKTSSGLPIRVIDESAVGRNEEFYNKYKERLQEIYGYSEVGYDGKNQVYKSKLCGYNQTALKELEDYVIEGSFSAGNLGKDEIILSVLRMGDSKKNDIPGFYKEGIPLMDYHAGDRITFKYRKDLQTNALEYEQLQDEDSEYVYRTVEVAAIVAFPYMVDSDRTIYPLLITEDRYIQEIAPNSAFQSIYLDGKKEMSVAEQKELERTLIRLGTVHSDVSTRSLIDEIEKNEMLYQKKMVYIYGIAIISFILVIINMVNNLRYRMQTRTKEVCMLRAIGMSILMIKKMLMFENLILGAVGIMIAFFLSQPIEKYLYDASDMRAFGHSYSFDYAAFALISGAALFICIVLSTGILKEWKTRNIVEGIGKVE